MTTYQYGPDVQFRRELVDGGPQYADVLVTRACPSCSADWTKPDAVRMGYQVVREVMCWSCMTFHRQSHVRS